MGIVEAMRLVSRDEVPDLPDRIVARERFFKVLIRFAPTLEAVRLRGNYMALGGFAAFTRPGVSVCGAGIQPAKPA